MSYNRTISSKICQVYKSTEQEYEEYFFAKNVQRTEKTKSEERFAKRRKQRILKSMKDTNK